MLINQILEKFSSKQKIFQATCYESDVEYFFWQTTIPLAGASNKLLNQKLESFFDKLEVFQRLLSH